MTHDELIERLDGQIAGSKAIGCECRACDNAIALRAVVELHKPIKDEWIEYTTCKACRVGGDDHYSPEYPCLTIQAIEKNL